MGFDRIQAEDGILALIQGSSLWTPDQILQTLEISDGATPIISESNQLLVAAPAVIIQPGPVEHIHTDVYGRTGSASIYISLILVGISFRGPVDRTHGNTDDDTLGIYQMADIVRDAVRGKNAYGSANRIFLVREEPGPWVGGGVLYTITVRLAGEIPPL